MCIPWLTNAEIFVQNPGKLNSWIILLANSSDFFFQQDSHELRFSSTILFGYISFFTIEKLLTSEGRELRRALFSLKQIFQDVSIMLIDLPNLKGFWIEEEKTQRYSKEEMVFFLCTIHLYSVSFYLCGVFFFYFSGGFQDKDLVHGFVALGGLNSLVRVGNNADQNYQNYILRALGQVIIKRN